MNVLHMIITAVCRRPTLRLLCGFWFLSRFSAVKLHATRRKILVESSVPDIDFPVFFVQNPSVTHPAHREYAFVCANACMPQSYAFWRLHTYPPPAVNRLLRRNGRVVCSGRAQRVQLACPTTKMSLTTRVFVAETSSVPSTSSRGRGVPGSRNGIRRKVNVYNAYPPPIYAHTTYFTGR